MTLQKVYGTNVLKKTLRIIISAYIIYHSPNLGPIHLLYDPIQSLITPVHHKICGFPQLTTGVFPSIVPGQQQQKLI